MFNYLYENISTILVGIVLILIITLVARKLIKDKRNGKNNCGCNCGNCASSGMCHLK